MSTRFGLDIGRRAVKLVRLDFARRSTEPRSVRAAMRDIAAKDGTEALEATVRAIRECAEELGALGSEVTVAVPRSESVVKTVSLPAVPAEERSQLIRFQAAKDVPFELTDVVLANGVVGEQPGGATEVVYAAARNDVIDRLRSVVERAGLVTGVLEVSTQAAARAARLVAPDAQDAVLIVIGGLATDLCVLKGGKLVFSRSASVGSDRDPQETGKAEAEQWLERLTAEVQRSLRGYTNGSAPPGEGAKHLLLAGGGATAEGVAEALSAHLGLPARVLDPTGERGSPALLVARGLAEARVVPGIPTLDFAGRADARLAAKTRQRTIAVSALAGLLLLGGGFALQNEVSNTKRRADALESELKDLKPSLDEVKKLIHENDVVRGWDLRKGRSLEILLSVSRAIPKDDAYLTRFQWSEGHPVQLAGRVRDNESWERFLRRLNRETIFSVVVPDAISPQKRDATKGQDVTITAKLHELPGERPK